MISVEEQVRTAMLADATVFGLLGTRIYLVQLPQNPTFPCCAYQRVSTRNLNTHGLGGAIGQVGWTRFQFSIWAQGPTAGSLTDTIARAMLAVFYGSFNAYHTAQSPEVIRQAPNFLLNRSMGIEPQTQPPLFKSIFDVKIWYQDQ